METDGMLAPESAAAARESFADLATAAETVVRESAKAMNFDEAAFDERVTADVFETAHEALFASLLEVRVGTYEELLSWADDADYEVELMGSEEVDNAVWHVPAFGDTAVAATFQDEQAAAAATLRRQAYGRIYREVVA